MKGEFKMTWKKRDFFLKKTIGIFLENLSKIVKHTLQPTKLCNSR